MIDNITMVADISHTAINFNETKNIQIGNITMIPILSPKTGEVTKYQSVSKNLLFTLKDEKLVISNSLHKFYKGNNYTDFKHSELIQAIEYIETLTNIKANNFYLRKVEFGLNIETNNKPHQYLSSFSDFKGKEFDKMRSKPFWYGNKYPFTEYALKIYDKTEQTKRVDKINIQKNILRFEIQYFKSRKIPFPIQTLNDLKIKSNISNLYKNFIQEIKKLNCIGDEDFTCVNSRAREMYYAGQNSNFWVTEKAINVQTFKKKKQRYKEIQKIVTNRNLICDFIKRLESKFNLLIES